MNAIYPSAKVALSNGDIDWTDDTIKAILVNGHSYDAANDFLDDVEADEISGTGYTAGGAEVPGRTVSEVGTAANLIGTAIQWINSTIDADGVIIYKDTGVASTSQLIMYSDITPAISTSSGTATVSFPGDLVAEVD